MTILNKLVIAGRKYTGNDGKEKTVWHTVGHLHQTQDGSRRYITLDPKVNLAAFPIKDGDDRVYVNLFEPDEDKKPAAKHEAPAQGKPDPFDDTDLPF